MYNIAKSAVRCTTTPGGQTRPPCVAAKRAVPKLAVAVAVPKLNKAELECQVIKLERTIPRFRKQNAELKIAAREEAAEAPVTAAATQGASRHDPEAAPERPRGQRWR